MVIIPRVLTSLIQELDQNYARHLALTFAQRTIEVCGGVLSSSPERDIALSYLGAARDFLDGKETISGLGDAHRAYFAARPRNVKASDDVTWIAAIAVSACCQRQMEDAGIVSKNRFRPSLLDVAKDGQAFAGRCAVLSEGDPKDGDSSTIARRARWLEARWQLLQLIESLPFPAEGDPEAGRL